MERDGMGQDGMGWDKWDTLPEMPYIHVYIDGLCGPIVPGEHQ